MGKLQAKKGNSMTPQPRDWRELAEKVSQEMDPDKLEGLIDELNRTLDRDEKASPPRRSVTPGLRRSCTILRAKNQQAQPRDSDWASKKASSCRADGVPTMTV